MSLVRFLAGLVLSCWIAKAGILTALSQTPAHPLNELEREFVHPPDSARPWVYWFWMDGNVTRAGITADLEAMSRVGIGGALLMDVTQDLPRGPVLFGSSEWMELFKHAVAEAGRLGLELTVNNDAGWSGSGGPWITPALAMRKVVTTKTNLIGPLQFQGMLPQLPGNHESNQPVATIAFPALGGEGGPLPGFPPEKVTFNGAELTGSAKLFDGDPRTFVSIRPPTPRKPQYLQLEFARPFTATTLRLLGTGRSQRFQGTLQVSDNGRAFHDVRDFSSSRSNLVLPFERTSARFYRLCFTQANSGPEPLEFSELDLAPIYQIPWFQSKTGAGPMPVRATSPQSDDGPAFAITDPTKVVDLTGQTDPGGSLTWDVPKGTWTVLRFMSAPVGIENRSASMGGMGLECDKLSREAIEKHFGSFVGRLAAEVGRGSALKATHIDSWEIGFQNWTPRFREEFQRLRGYDPLPYLPAYTGRFVGAADQSERFLWDVRRTIADLLADNYAGHLAELAHQNGLKLSIEAYASLGKGPFDDLTYAGRADIPMAEFWFGTNDLSKLDLRPMPSAAHTYGKPITAAEAFTSEPAYSKWQEYPFALKPLADAAFCEGINRLVFHRFAHQPLTNRAPGMTMGPFGVHYERTQTWWEQSRPWHEYLARCQLLLQRGLFVADICYLTSEGAFTQPPSRDQLKPTPPPGYNYDLAAPEVVLNRVSVKDGELMLPDGMTYRVLALPEEASMTPELLRKVKRLVEAGASVVGPKPARSPSLTGYPQCDIEVKRLAGELWGPCDGRRVKENRVGKGSVFWGKSLSEILGARRLEPDFVARDSTSGAPLHYIHRRIDGAEVYFIANPNPRGFSGDCQFRILGKRPEFWHPDSGEIEPAAAWQQHDNVTTIPLRLEAGGSLFVVFRQSAAGADPVVQILRDGQMDDSTRLIADPNGTIRVLANQPGTYTAKLSSGKTVESQIKDIPPEVPIIGNWDLYFPAHLGAPEHVTLDRLVSWAAHTNPGVKYFSGTARYEKSFNLSGDLIKPDRRVILNLGRVQIIAQLKLNGVDLGILWKPPFEVDITRSIRTGENLLEVKVVNLWPNRLIGDEQLPDDCKWQQPAQPEYGYAIAEWPSWLLQDKPSPSGRFTFTTWKHWHKDSPLFESGLVGPVTLRVLEQRTLR